MPGGAGVQLPRTARAGDGQSGVSGFVFSFVYFIQQKVCGVLLTAASVKT